MHSELASQRVHAYTLCVGCSHSVHFLLGEACSSASLWLFRHVEQRVFGLVFALDIPTIALIPRGDKPLNPWSSVPAALDCFHLIGHRTVHDNVALGGLYQHLSPAARAEEADRHIAQVGLSHRRDALAGTLSGGESQRAAVARSLMGDPLLLLCDEPTGNLDSQNTEAILALLEALNADGMTIVVITHEEEVARRAGRRVVLRDGAVEE